MIDINELQKNDELEFNDNTRIHAVTFIEISRLHKGRIFTYSHTDVKYTGNISKEYINDYCISWKRDGVELLKQEEEKPLYVFCPIEKNDECFYVNCVNLPCETTCFRVDALGLLTRFGDYTFISYANDKSKPPPLAKSPVYRMIDQDCPKVAKYAVFVKTSELNVVGK